MEKELKQLSDKNLNNRIISAGIMIPLIFIAVYFGGILFFTIILAAAIILSFEWQGMLNNDLLLNTEKRLKWSIFGFLLIFIPCLSLIILRSFSFEQYGIDGRSLLFILITIIILVDTFAYFVGKKLQGPKLAPSISPGKTWAGLIGGVGAIIIFATVLSLFLNLPNKLSFVIICIILAVIEQASDLLESLLKRRFGVKDSGKLIPGHGGLFDRVDGFILTAPIALIILFITQGNGIFK